MRDYKGKTIYMGIDVHKKSYAVTVICDRQIVKRDRLEADPALLLNYCRKNFKDAKIFSAYEAGFSGFALHRDLVSQGIDNQVIHPAGIEVAVKARVKNDKRDSAKISSQLAEQRLRGIYIPTTEREGYREISRLRESFIRKKVRSAAHIKSFLHRHGLFTKLNDKPFCKTRILELMRLELSRDLTYTLRKFCEEWLHLNEQIKEVESRLKEQAMEDDLEKTYRSLPGVGPVAARTLANELGDLMQFANEKQLFCYTGLTPREHSSGEHRWLGHISRQGKPIVRKVLVQAAWKAVKEDASVEKRFAALSARVGSKRAIVAIARILIGIARTCFKEKRLYEIR